MKRFTLPWQRLYIKIEPVRPPSVPSGYRFLQGKDNITTNIGNRTNTKNNIGKLKKWCDENPKCKEFNSSGWMKGNIGKIYTMKGFTGYIKYFHNLFSKT